MKIQKIKITVLVAQAGLILHDLALTRLENLHHSSNLHDNFWFSTFWHRQFVAAI